MMLLQKAHHINFIGKPNWNDNTVMFSLSRKKRDYLDFSQESVKEI